ncbi:serpin family protein [Leptolyngbya ohadii]|uniref:serpin family protein n=1 Tax=Leptolyngbya ohadii TaxID=1962290 RepID=UPI000B59AF1D|nr:serpin family protein [Leptolyngbya ohadii]
MHYSVTRRRVMMGVGGILLGMAGSGAFRSRQAEAQSTAQSSPLLPLQSPSPPSATMQTSSSSSALVGANHRFGFKLFSQLLQENRGENVVISPSSVAIALSMTYNGANAATQEAMQQTLELQGMSLAEINQANQALLTTWASSDPAVQMTVANSLWARTGLPFEPDFLKRNQEFYRAEVTELDFSDRASIDRINSWVNQQTQGKIDRIVDQISPNDILFLVNAIYFKGKWTNPFNASETVDRPFRQADGTTTNQPLMTKRGQFRYLETDQFQAVRLPYGEGRWQMAIFLPKPESSLDRFTASLNQTNWETWINQFASRPGTVQIPRFKVEYGTSLVESLKAIGMETAFNSQNANFSGITPLPAYISDVQHKTLLEVNEEGTEAAAATSVAVAVRAAMPMPPFQMTVDRPFFCAIWDEETGTILFMGAIEVLE